MVNWDGVYRTAATCDNFRECPKCGKCRNYDESNSKCEKCSIKAYYGLCKCTEKKILEFHQLLWKGKRPTIDVSLYIDNDNK
jgi:hypothetical protein